MNLSCCLINLQTITDFSLTGSSFDNIWVINNKILDATTQYQSVLLNINGYIGDLTLGSSVSQLTVKNIIGFLNPHTVKRYPTWSLSLLSDMDMYGTIAPLITLASK